MSMAAIAVVATPLVLGGINAAVQKNKANKMEGDILAANGVVEDALSARQDLDEAVYDPGDDIRAMKSMVSNPMANLAVATQAAKLKIEQTDIALANTLDTLMATGAGAGGATALAQAALKSKMGISASIEQQEANNEKLRAQGAMEVQKLKAGGEQWKWAQQETREMQKLDREQALMDNDLQQQQMHQQNVYNEMGNIAGTLGSVAGGITSSENYEFDTSTPFWNQGQ